MDLGVVLFQGVRGSCLPGVVPRIRLVWTLRENRPVRKVAGVGHVRVAEHLGVVACPVGSLHAPSSLVVSVLEHVLVLRVQRPVVALPLATALPRDLHEALVQTEVVADRVLPALFILLKVRKSGRNVAVDLAQRRSLHLGVLGEEKKNSYVTNPPKMTGSKKRPSRAFRYK